MNQILSNKVLNFDWEDIIKSIEDNSIDCVITDPPYGMSFRSNHRKIKHKEIQNDDNLEWVPDWVSELKRVCKEDAHLYIFISWHNVDIFKIELAKKFKVKNILVWEKNNTGMGDLEGDYAPKHELIIFCSNGSKKLNGARDSNILRAKRTQNENHPTEKPIELIEYLVSKSTQKGDLILDTFSGSFTTAKACKKLSRNFICCEIEKDYCDSAELVLNKIHPIGDLFGM